MGYTDTDNGYKRTLAAIFGKTPKLKVGIFGPKADQEVKGTTVLDYATFNEFGLGVPERSFIRAWCDENEGAVVERLRHDSELATRGKLTWEQVMDRLGLYCVGGMQQRIADRIEPPNAESTIKEKGSDVPLIDEGILRSAITHEVVR